MRSLYPVQLGGFVPKFPAMCCDRLEIFPTDIVHEKVVCTLIKRQLIKGLGYL